MHILLCNSETNYFYDGLFNNWPSGKGLFIQSVIVMNDGFWELGLGFG